MQIYILKKALVLSFLILTLMLCFYFERNVVVSGYMSPVYQGNPEKKQVAFLCNVYWGEEIIPEMLKILEKEKVKLSFFLGGIWAKKHPEIVRQIKNAGHEIGNHGYLHKHPDLLSVKENEEEILKTEKIIEEICGYKTYLFTPPYGERGKNVLQAATNLKYRTVMWSIDTIDWQKPAPGAIINRVLPNLNNGAIILIHPMPQTLEVLPILIKKIKAKGYRIVTVGEIID
ncbi:polysaccharide deacetylase [Carboxydothermus islandicus]|uniref:Polysaccharide deacetylase n=1 Tax=Carboxydothermus islandicus TaxID=661089 RepID=A0A1L8D573_9THEO|nr:polysaccharide deacetylase family protein [Carboxydothermus islandicus]GAV26298.1 polysaccharide deacetylase [Carboxydothermus islandicus]